MEGSNKVARGLHTWAFQLIMGLSLVYLLLCFIDKSVALSVNVVYASTVLIISVIGAKQL